MMTRLKSLLHRETVFCVSLALALLSMAAVPPDRGYLAYPDYRTLALLFCLMLIVAGFQSLGAFALLGRVLLGRTGSLRGLAAVLIPLAGWPALFIALYHAADQTPLAWLLDSILAGAVYTVLPSWTFIMDGGITYILMGIVLYLLRRHRGWQAAAFVAMELLFYLALPMQYLIASGSFAPGLLFTTAFEWMGVFAVVPMLLYNGQRGRGMKQLFYIFYPAHVYLLYALSWAVLLLTR